MYVCVQYVHIVWAYCNAYWGEKSRKKPNPKFLGLYVLDVFLKSCARIEGALTSTDPFCGQASLTPKVKFAWLV